MRHFGFTVTLVALLAGCSDDAPKAASLELGSFAPPSLALAKAEAMVPEGFAVEMELEIGDDDDDDVTHFEFEFLDATGAVITKIDSSATTGDVTRVRTKPEDDDDFAGVAFGDLIGLGAAIGIASKRVPGGFVLEAELEVEDGAPIYEVELYVESDGSLMEVELDAATGAVIEVEREDD